MKNWQSQNWLYEGVWGILSTAFCVPRHSPTLPSISTEQIENRKPSVDFLRYLKFQFLVVFAIMASVLIAVSVALVVTKSQWFLLLVLAVVIFLAALFAIAYVAIHLRFDTMWYVFSDRSMRLRRGIWQIRESTITFENIQNVKVTQGPLQRWFGISDVVVETAGGGGSATDQGGQSGSHAGVIEGVSDAAEIRDLIMGRVQQSQNSGLGDEGIELSSRATIWTSSHLKLLEEINMYAKLASGRPQSDDL